MTHHPIDHLVYATPDLDATVELLAGQLGVRASTGGQHPGLGTRNALLALGPRVYLEIVGPDPEQSAPQEGRWFRIDTLSAPALVTWCAAGRDLPTLHARAAAVGVALGEVRDGGRVRPDGVTLAWQVTSPFTEIEHGLLPFFIDWLESPHPAESAAGGVSLGELVAEHPEPDALSSQYAALGLDVAVRRGPVRRLIATLEGPSGRAVLR